MSTAVQHIRQAVAHEAAAGRHEGKAEEQLKSAGAEMYAAFVLAAKGSEELRGRKLDDKAIARLYHSTKPRPWWDAALKEGGFGAGDKASRQKAAYLIQWHVDIDSARARRAQGRLQQASAQKALRKQRDMRTRSMTSRSESGSGVTAVEAQRITKAAGASALGGRELGGEQSGIDIAVDDLLGEAQRIQSSARKVKPVYRAEVLSILRAAARDIERYIA